MKKFSADNRSIKIFLSVGMALITLLVSYNGIYRASVIKIDKIKSDILEAKRCLVIRKDIVKVDNLIAGYGAYFYNKAAAETIRQDIIEAANRSGASVIGFQPLEQEGLGNNNYAKSSFRMKINCTYSQLGKLTENIENLPHAVHIEDIIVDIQRDFNINLRDIGQGQPDMAKDKTQASLLVSAYCRAK